MYSQWEWLMRKFSMDHKRTHTKCKTTLLDHTPIEQRPVMTFHTGSKYEGTWDDFGMCGYGMYTFPNGVIYEGEFEDNLFHGDGELRYPDGTIVRGQWYEGELIDSASSIIFPDDIHYKGEDWTYCKAPDRRFSIEYENGIAPAGNSYLTAEQPPREVPPGTYDCGNGFFDPKTKVIYKNDDLCSITKTADPRLLDWILKNCRKSNIGQVGPAPELYKQWKLPKLEPTPPPSPSCLSEEISSYDTGRSISQCSSGSYAMWRRFSEGSGAQKHATFKYDPAANVANTADDAANNTSTNVEFRPERSSILSTRKLSTKMFPSNISSGLYFL